MKISLRSQLEQLDHAAESLRTDDTLRSKEIDEIQSELWIAMGKVDANMLDCNSYANQVILKVSPRIDLLALYPDCAGVKESERDTLIPKDG